MKSMKTIFQLLPALLLAALSAPAQEYHLIDLGALIDPHSYALAINQRGQVAGYGRTETGARAFLYRGGVITDLGPLGGTNSYGTSINLFGQVAGFSDMTNGPRAFVFRDGVAQRLETLAGLDHYAFGINDAGWVVGYVSLPAGDQAFVFDGVEATLLGTLGGLNSYAYAINSIGFVVGSSTMAGEAGRHAMAWDGIELLDLNVLMPAPNGWELEEARAINDQRLMTGWGLLHGSRRAFLFNQGTVTDLGTLAEGRASRGLGINNAGEVVGTAEVAPKGEPHAFIWRNGQMRDVNDFLGRNSGWELREARGINDGGQIVGWGSVRGREHAFLLIPEAETQSSQREKNPGHQGGSPPPSDIIFTLASGGSSISVTNSPLADAHVKDGSSTNVNFGSATLMELQTSSTAGNNRDVYFRFPIDNAPSPIGSAKLRVFVSLAANGSVVTTTYSVTDTNWAEGTIVWTNRPALGTAQVNATFNVKAGASYDIDVTSFVRAEQAAGRGIITLAFHCTNNTSPLASVSSKENGTTANRPVLVINTNAFPTVSMTSPVNNSTYPGPTNLALSATASDSDGTVTNVEFYAGSYLIGADATSPYSFTWTNAPIGTHALKAVAYDEFGAVGTSAVVNVTIATNILPLADAHVKSDSATSNFGQAVQLEVQTNGASGPTRDAYLKFSLAGLTNISSAKIRYFAAKSSGSGSVSGTWYSVADTNWIEFGSNSITWNNRPPVSNALSHVSVSGTSLAWYTNDVTTFVQGESAAGRLILTLALHSQTNNSTFIKFNSHETNSPPELVLTTSNTNPYSPTADTDGDGVSDYLEWLMGRNLLVGGTTNDANGVLNLQRFTPLQ
jgi:probable HAF family extracellular repeat protein